MSQVKSVQLFLGILLLFSASCVRAQGAEEYVTTTINGQVLRAIVIDGDTIPVVDLDQVQVSSKRNFNNPDERRRYKQLRYNALKVYPYAAQAIKIYRNVQYENSDLSRRKAKRSNKEREVQLTAEYEQKLKSLTKTQGYILIKMIERELKVPFYDIIKELRGGWSAFKWQMLARSWGFNLKSGYEASDDPELEMILSDLNISYGGH